MGIFCGSQSLVSCVPHKEEFAGLLQSFCAGKQYFCVLTPTSEAEFSLSLCRLIQGSVAEIFAKECIAHSSARPQNCIGIKWEWKALPVSHVPLSELIQHTSSVILSTNAEALDTLMTKRGIPKESEDQINTQIAAANLDPQALIGMTQEDAIKSMQLEERIFEAPDPIQRVLWSIELLETVGKPSTQDCPLTDSFSWLTGIRPPQSEGSASLVNEDLAGCATFQGFRV